MSSSKVSSRQWLAFWSAGILLVAVWSYLFLEFFPNRNGRLGHDYSQILPHLLAGYYWFRENGLMSIPYFTPAFCGGEPLYSSVTGIYYSLPQFLAFFMDPLRAVSVTFVTFSMLGYLGFCLLLLRVFNCHLWSVLLGATLFLFNDFYTYRIIVGHLSFHSFMLIPLIVFFLLYKTASARSRWQNLWYAIPAALLVAYMIYSGGAGLLLQFGFAVLALILVYAITHTLEAEHWMRIGVTLLLIPLLAASKLTALFSTLHSLPRDAYPLPGISSLVNAFWVPFKSLFIVAENNSLLYTDLLWLLDRHVFEYGLTVIPLIILCAWVLALFAGKIRIAPLAISGIGYLVALVVLLIIPVLLNYYNPAWNAILKGIPIIKNSSSMVRWYLIYIPVMVLLTALAFNQLDARKLMTPVLAAVLVILLVGINATVDKSYYHNNGYSTGYDPRTVVDNHQEVRKSGKIRKISSIIRGKESDMFIFGYSQLNCYQPMFGYMLEFFPKKDLLRSGDIYQEDDGILNMKNPACYTYPEANQCVPGDHFKVQQKEELQRFSAYQPYTFTLSRGQRIANKISLFALIISLLVLVISGLRYWKQRL